MSKQRFWVPFLAAGCVAMSTLTAIPAAAGTSVPATAAGAEVQVAAAGEEVLDRFTTTHALTGQTVTVTKSRGPDGQVRQTATDGSGRSVDLDAVAAQEEQARSARFGKLDAHLAAKVDRAKPTEAVPVSIWTAEPAALPQDRSVGLTAHLQAVERATLANRAGVLDVVRKAGGRAASAAQYAPVVFAELTPGQLRRVVRDARIDTVYAQTDYSTMNDDGTTTEGAQLVWQTGNLGAGTSSRPVVHEPDGVSDYNPWLANATHPVLFWCSSVSAACPAGKQINTPAFGTHASEVAGVIASTHAQHRGLAPSAQMILSANTQDFSDARLVAAYEWARGNGGDPVNMSWGSTCPDGRQNFMSRYVDWAVRNLFSTFTISSGNTRGCAARDLQVSAPGVAWSAITVGAISDGGTGAWGGDAVSGFSRHQNPDFAPGMEKPEVVAVGQARRTTTDSGISAGSNGTSFSAPAVAGQVTQMLSRRPGQNVWPETNKAAVLTSAFHDVVGGFGDRSQDGVGAVVAGVSDTIYRNGQFVNGFTQAATGADVNRTTASFTAGQTVRASVAWTSRSTGGAGTDTLGADIDLCVTRNDTGAVVTCSASVQNAWETVQFVAPVTGGYTLRSYVFSQEAGWPGTYFGVAWAARATPNVCSGAVAVPATGGTFTNQTTANGGTYIDSYTGWGTEQTHRERLYRLTTTATRDLRITDNNAAAHVHIVRISACSDTAFTVTTLANGAATAFVDNAPAGTYYAVLDSAAAATAPSGVTVSLAVTGP